MCTDRTMKSHISEYVRLSDEIARLEKLKKAESQFIIAEMESRQTTYFCGQNIITGRLNERATAAGMEELKALHPENIDTYINVSLSQYPNKAACKKAL